MYGPVPARSLTEHVFSYQRQQQSRSGGITLIGDVHASRKILPRVCIAKAAVNESFFARIPKLTMCSLQVQQFLLPFRPHLKS